MFRRLKNRQGNVSRSEISSCRLNRTDKPKIVVLPSPNSILKKVKLVEKQIKF